MQSEATSVKQLRFIVFMTMWLAGWCFLPLPAGAAVIPVVVQAAGFGLGPESAATDGTNRLELTLDSTDAPALPFCQSAIKQGRAPARLGPDLNLPYFTVRFALPIPPENATNLDAALTGLDPNVFTHNHSPGFEILPNGDALAVYFSTPPGKAEADPSTTFIQARLRYGAVEWDLPELFFKTENYNDQSGLLWNDDGKIWFFGGGRELSDTVPFKVATSVDNGATWKLWLPQLDRPAEGFAAQPITSAFRSGTGSLPVSFAGNISEGQKHTGKLPVPLFFAMDGDGATSFLWRSLDDGIHWHDMGGRTGGRHSVIVPLDDQGELLSIGGKNAAVNGWSPENHSTNWGVSWSESIASPFPPLGTAQRPSLIKLANGHLFFVSDAYLNKIGRVPPPGWEHGNGCFVAISTNNGASWHIKTLPVELPNFQRGTNGTLGYVTARQAPNGVINILTTETQPCLQYELNEAWIFSDAGDIAPENSGGTIKQFSEKYPNGKPRSEWSARICPHGRYLLNGRETDYYDNGAKQHEVTYASGRKTGRETFWSPDGKTLWIWSHNLKANRSVWTQFWPNGNKKSESTWNTQPEARDLKRRFFGLVADGSARQWNEDGSLKFSGNFADGLLMPKEAQ